MVVGSSLPITYPIVFALLPRSNSHSNTLPSLPPHFHRDLHLPSESLILDSEYVLCIATVPHLLTNSFPLSPLSPSLPLFALTLFFEFVRVWKPFPRCMYLIGSIFAWFGEVWEKRVFLFPAFRGYILVNAAIRLSV